MASVIALITDGEEAGLLGAAAFVREHPLAKDVAFVLNFEARGTSGRSFMFETGPGNLDAARALRKAGNATAGSVYATIYRTLPNDTDLSEIAVLDLPHSTSRLRTASNPTIRVTTISRTERAVCSITGGGCWRWPGRSARGVTRARTGMVCSSTCRESVVVYPQAFQASLAFSRWFSS